jgi:hypothetical protein
MLTTAERLRDVEGDLDQLLEAATATLSDCFSVTNMTNLGNPDTVCKVCNRSVTWLLGGRERKAPMIAKHHEDCPIPALGAAVMQAHRWYGV